MKTTHAPSHASSRLPKYLLSALLAPVVLAPVAAATFFAAPRAALAQGAKSSLLGIALPRGGAAYDEVTSNFSALLSKIAAEKAVGQTPTGDEPEVFLWRGASYREDRVPFTKSGLQRSLEEAGWTVKEIDDGELREVNIFEAFDNTNGNELPFAQSVGKPSKYFQGINAKAGKAFIGAWLQSDDALALGLLPVEFVAPKPKAAISGAAAGAVLVKDSDDVTKGLPKPKLPTFPRMAPKPGTVRGVALDTSGRPLANVEVAVYSSIGGGARTTHKARTNAQGVYQVLVPAGICEVAQADYKLTYNGVEYGLMLEPVRGEFTQFNSAKGHVENLILRTGGKSGGTIYIRDNVEGMVELTVAPVGKLMDGSSGRTFVFRFDSTGKHEQYLNGLPLGRYKITARLFDDGEALPLRVGNSVGYGKDTTMRPSLQVDFEPGYTFSQYNFGKSARDIQFLPVTLEP